MRVDRVLLSEVRSALLDGAYVEFHWNTCQPYLVYRAGNRMSLDGRSYQGFLQTMADKFHETKLGSMEQGDLVIRWQYDK